MISDEEFIERVAQRVVELQAKSPVVQPRLLDIPSAAIYLNRTEAAIRKLIERRTIRAVAIDGKVQIDIRVLEKLIKESAA